MHVLGQRMRTRAGARRPPPTGGMRVSGKTENQARAAVTSTHHELPPAPPPRTHGSHAVTSRHTSHAAPWVWREGEAWTRMLKKIQQSDFVEERTRRTWMVCKQSRLALPPKEESTNFTPAMAVLTLCLHLFVDSSGICRRF
ncbi:unnamed protein product, partial [Gulo gulo]